MANQSTLEAIRFQAAQARKLADSFDRLVTDYGNALGAGGSPATTALSTANTALAACSTAIGTAISAL